MTPLVRNLALKKRIVIVFLSAVLLPGLILSYLGLISIQHYVIVPGNMADIPPDTLLLSALVDSETDLENNLIVHIDRLTPLSPKNPKFLYYFLFSALVGLFFAGIVFFFRDVYREKELAKQQKDFLLALSHDIRSPVAAIRMLSGNLNDGTIDDPNKQKTYLHLIEHEAKRLSNIAEYTLISSGKSGGLGELSFYTERVKVPELLQSLIDRLTLLNEEQNLVLVTDIPDELPEIEISRDWIEEAIFNLLDNAMKFSDKETYIELRAAAVSEGVVISVSDKGIGINRDEQQKIYEKFFRSKVSEKRKIPGIGIGLWIVKKIVSMHNGRIELNSEPGKGSTFSIILPAAKSMHDLAM